MVADLVSIDFVPVPGFGEEEWGESPRSTELFSMLYADDADIVARTSASLAKIMTAIVEKCAAFGLTVSEKKTETMVLRPPEESAQQLMIQSAEQRYAQKERLKCLGGTISEDADMSAKLKSRARSAYGAIHRYNQQLYDRATAIVSLELKVKLLRSEVLGALIYGCDTWTLLQKGYDFLRKQHRRLLRRYIGFRKKNRTDYTLSYLSALEKTGCKFNETTVRRLRLLLASRIHRMGNHRYRSACYMGS